MKYKSEVVCVTGGAGLIGSFLLELLLKDYSKVVIADDFSTGIKQNIMNVAKEIEIREGNLENFDFCKKALHKCDHVYHLASRAFGIGYNNSNHLEMLFHNEKVTNNLMDCLRFSNAERLLVTSSSCVYDDQGPDIIPELPVFLDNPEKANKGYGWAKRFLECKTQILSEETGIKTIVVRPFNIYGERYKWRGENSQAIPMLISKLLSKNKSVDVWGSGNQRRNYLHAKDCADIMKQLFDTCYTDGPINIGTKKTISIKELVELIIDLTNSKTIFNFDLTKPEGRTIKSSDTKLLYSLLPKYKPEISLRSGLSKMIKWYNNLIQNHQ